MTSALVPGALVVTVPIATVAALPELPVAPSSPLGMVKLSILFVAVDDASTETVALVPASPVVTVPTLTEGVLPSRPSKPAGIVKLSILLVAVELGASDRSLGARRSGRHRAYRNAR